MLESEIYEQKCYLGKPAVVQMGPQRAELPWQHRHSFSDIY